MQCFVFALIYVGYGTNWAIFKDLSYGGKGSGNPCWLCFQKLSKSLPTSHHRISGRMLLLTFLGPLLLPVHFFCCCWIPWCPAVGSMAHGQTLIFCTQTQWFSCGIFSKQSDLRFSLLRGWSHMQPRFNQLPNLTSENKERQPCWRVPSRRHHVSDPRLIKHTGGILYKHLKAECYIPVCTAMACNKRTQDNDVQAHILKSPNFCKYTLRTYRDTFKWGRVQSQLNSVTSEVSFMSKRKSCNRRSQEKSEKDRIYGESW